MKRQIIAMGGGGFSMEEPSALDKYIISQARQSVPSICFLPTASGDAESYILKFYRCFRNLGCRPIDLPLFKRNVKDLRDFLCDQDVIYVGGGNTANMLSIWETHGVDKALKTAYQNGTILCGLSAGSICWFEEGVTDSFGNDLKKLDCLGIIPGSNCPHYDSEDNRKPAYHSLIKNGMKNGYAAYDFAALHFINEKLERAISSTENALAFQVELKNGSVIEKSLDMKYIG